MRKGATADQVPQLSHPWTVALAPHPLPEPPDQANYYAFVIFDLVLTATKPVPLWLLSPLHKASRQITVHLTAICAGYGVSVAEGHLLTYLASYGPCPIAELSRVFGLSGSTLTGMLDRLAAGGQLLRGLNAADRRSYLIELTPAGRETALALNARLAGFEAEVRSRLGEEQVAGFKAVMDAVEDVTHVNLRGGVDGDEGAGRSVRGGSPRGAPDPG